MARGLLKAKFVNLYIQYTATPALPQPHAGSSERPRSDANDCTCTCTKRIIGSSEYGTSGSLSRHAQLQHAFQIRLKERDAQTIGPHGNLPDYADVDPQGRARLGEICSQRGRQLAAVGFIKLNNFRLRRARENALAKFALLDG